jgi:hypothetical protein
MTLSEEVRERLADVVELQPTKNGELQERWGMDSGSDVHQFLETELSDYYYRDADSLIRATEEANELVDVEPGALPEDDGRPDPESLDGLEAQSFAVLAGPDERTQSVVSVLHELRTEFDVDASAEEVRKALRSLVRSGLVETEQRTVPTFRRTIEVEEFDGTVEETAREAASGDAEDEDEILDDIEHEVTEAAGEQ